ncbi:putative Serine/threonine-protein kinase ark1 [Paratrimastix pyriformis]|uniref:Serine/threonine-protein kinase ark1 n=1 Tax=Paratrimastix pyriformis TaxID=342808 RepID=A0ABQ8UQN6_9EUKA|nr:putative Serine/threonine-protein kinase ark1 [Paratrimastix pyriformis]
MKRVGNVRLEEHVDVRIVIEDELEFFEESGNVFETRAFSNLQRINMTLVQGKPVSDEAEKRRANQTLSLSASFEGAHCFRASSASSRAFKKLSAEPGTGKASLAHYRLSGLLGKGGFSRVYEAEDVRTGQRCAIKKIDKSLILAKKCIEYVHREIEIQGQLNHPNLVRLQESFEEADSICLVMELCSRGKVYHHLKSKGRFLDPEARFFFRQLCHGLAYLHHRDIIHRDLKLSNLLLTEDYTLKISDFGLAAYGSLEHHTICGTLPYLSPEIVNGEGHGMATDMWSLGIVLFQFLTGSPPFPDQSEQATRSLISEGHAPLPPLPTDITPLARNLLGRLLERDPERRITIDEVQSHPWVNATDLAMPGEYLPPPVAPRPRTQSAPPVGWRPSYEGGALPVGEENRVAAVPAGVGQTKTPVRGEAVREPLVNITPPSALDSPAPPAGNGDSRSPQGGGSHHRTAGESPRGQQAGVVPGGTPPAWRLACRVASGLAIPPAHGRGRRDVPTGQRLGPPPTRSRRPAIAASPPESPLALALLRLSPSGADAAEAEAGNLFSPTRQWPSTMASPARPSPRSPPSPPRQPPPPGRVSQYPPSPSPHNPLATPRVAVETPSVSQTRQAAPPPVPSPVTGYLPSPSTIHLARRPAPVPAPGAVATTPPEMSPSPTRGGYSLAGPAEPSFAMPAPLEHPARQAPPDHLPADEPAPAPAPEPHHPSPSGKGPTPVRTSPPGPQQQQQQQRTSPRPPLHPPPSPLPPTPRGPAPVDPSATSTPRAAPAGPHAASTGGRPAAPPTPGSPPPSCTPQATTPTQIFIITPDSLGRPAVPLGPPATSPAGISTPALALGPVPLPRLAALDRGEADQQATRAQPRAASGCVPPAALSTSPGRPCLIAPVAPPDRPRSAGAESTDGRPTARLAGVPRLGAATPAASVPPRSSPAAGQAAIPPAMQASLATQSPPQPRGPADPPSSPRVSQPPAQSASPRPITPPASSATVRPQPPPPTPGTPPPTPGTPPPLAPRPRGQPVAPPLGSESPFADIPRALSDEDTTTRLSPAARGPTRALAPDAATPPEAAPLSALQTPPSAAAALLPLRLRALESPTASPPPLLPSRRGATAWPPPHTRRLPTTCPQVDDDLEGDGGPPQGDSPTEAPEAPPPVPIPEPAHPALPTPLTPPSPAPAPAPVDSLTPRQQQTPHGDGGRHRPRAKSTPPPMSRFCPPPEADLPPPPSPEDEEDEAIPRETPTTTTTTTHPPLGSTHPPPPHGSTFPMLPADLPTGFPLAEDESTLPALPSRSMGVMAAAAAWRLQQGADPERDDGGSEGDGDSSTVSGLQAARLAPGRGAARPHRPPGATSPPRPHRVLQQGRGGDDTDVKRSRSPPAAAAAAAAAPPPSGDGASTDGAWSPPRTPPGAANPSTTGPSTPSDLPPPDGQAPPEGPGPVPPAAPSDAESARGQQPHAQPDQPHTASRSNPSASDSPLAGAMTPTGPPRAAASPRVPAADPNNPAASCSLSPLICPGASPPGEPGDRLRPQPPSALLAAGASETALWSSMASSAWPTLGGSLRSSALMELSAAASPPSPPGGAGGVVVEPEPPLGPSASPPVGRHAPGLAAGTTGGRATTAPTAPPTAMSSSLITSSCFSRPSSFLPSPSRGPAAAPAAPAAASPATPVARPSPERPPSGPAGPLLTRPPPQQQRRSPPGPLRGVPIPGLAAPPAPAPTPAHTPPPAPAPAPTPACSATPPGRRAGDAQDGDQRGEGPWTTTGQQPQGDDNHDEEAAGLPTRRQQQQQPPQRAALPALAQEVLRPIDTAGLPAFSHQGARCLFTLKPSGSLVMRVAPNRHVMAIAPGGTKVQFRRGQTRTIHTFPLAALPACLHPWYRQASRFVEHLRSLVPRVIYHSDQATSMLMSNPPHPDFLVRWYAPGSEGCYVTTRYRHHTQYLHITVPGQATTVLRNRPGQPAPHASTLPEPQRTLALHAAQCKCRCVEIERRVNVRMQQLQAQQSQSPSSPMGAPTQSASPSRQSPRFPVEVDGREGRCLARSIEPRVVETVEAIGMVVPSPPRRQSSPTRRSEQRARSAPPAERNGS